MPAPTSVPRPTPGELKLLSILWERGPSTVRDILDAQADANVGYTTVLKLLQIMDKKGLVDRDASRRPHIFRAAIAREETQRGLLGNLMERAFSGSAASLVLRALSDHRPSREELSEIRALLDRIEEEQA